MTEHLELRQLCVFCGSSPGSNPFYREIAGQLGRALAAREIVLVYGGGGIVLMGAVADATLAAGGQVTGVIPAGLASREVAHQNLTALEVVATMHERKARMADLADAFIALPGGFGTMEEFFEVLTWSQLGYHGKPCMLLDSAGYWSPLLAMADHATQEGFVLERHRSLLLHETDPVVAIQRLWDWKPSAPPKWADPADR